MLVIVAGWLALALASWYLLAFMLMLVVGNWISGGRLLKLKSSELAGCGVVMFGIVELANRYTWIMVLKVAGCGAAAFVLLAAIVMICLAVWGKGGNGLSVDEYLELQRKNNAKDKM